MNLLTLDPGNVTGWAMFRDKRLVAAGVVKKADAFILARQPGGLPLWTPAERVSMPEELVLIEMPRWYPHDHTDVNDLLDLSVYVGKLCFFYDEAKACPVELVWPRSWKGNVPKKITNNRTLAALSPEEVALLPRRPRAKDHDNNMLDAVGLGLWKLGRLR